MYIFIFLSIMCIGSDKGSEEINKYEDEKKFLSTTSLNTSSSASFWLRFTNSIETSLQDSASSVDKSLLTQDNTIDPLNLLSRITAFGPKGFGPNILLLDKNVSVALL
jgi:hypothetical protein